MSDKPRRQVGIFGGLLDSKPQDQIENIRLELSRLRGRLSDLVGAYGWKEHIELGEHGITLVISYLHGVIKDMDRCLKISGKERLERID